ncbi:unnamed protein product [Acanthosepion pharaonis]|uniref:Uncharacterized protein n=1 Tax=Acanthosepion pharaonis TaxID=158019 RepID=A0A812DER3_ACAPH|nr:unnamed protein product [Sepia pharaonis]
MDPLFTSSSSSSRGYIISTCILTNACAYNITTTTPASIIVDIVSAYIRTLQYACRDACYFFFRISLFLSAHFTSFFLLFLLHLPFFLRFYFHLSNNIYVNSNVVYWFACHLNYFRIYFSTIFRGLVLSFPFQSSSFQISFFFFSNTFDSFFIFLHIFLDFLIYFLFSLTLFHSSIFFYLSFFFCIPYLFFLFLLLSLHYFFHYFHSYFLFAYFHFMYFSLSLFLALKHYSLLSSMLSFLYVFFLISFFLSF